MTTVLLYSPMLTGHPQVYCRVIGDILLEQGAKLVLATSEIDELSTKWPDLSPFVGHLSVEIVSTQRFSAQGGVHLTAEELRNLQIAFRAESTLFIEPEYFREEFVRIFRNEAKTLKGRNVGIFGRTTEWFPREEVYGGEPISRLRGGFRGLLGMARRRIQEPWNLDRYFFEQVLLASKILDTVIVKDERLAERLANKVEWLPEIYKVFKPSESLNRDTEYESLKPGLDEFLACHAPDNRVLFFGSGAWYKGYDYFLKLLMDDPSSAGIHAGSGVRQVPGKDFIGDPVSSRQELLKQGRLFESGGYVESQRLIDEVFSACPRFVSTHRLTLSSGTMLQALDYGRPVLVPDGGLVGHRARENVLGMTYRYGDSADLARKWKAFKKEPIEQFQGSISTFMKKFDRSAVELLVKRTLLDPI